MFEERKGLPGRRKTILSLPVSRRANAQYVVSIFSTSLIFSTHMGSMKAADFLHSLTGINEGLERLSVNEVVLCTVNAP